MYKLLTRVAKTKYPAAIKRRIRKKLPGSGYNPSKFPTGVYGTADNNAIPAKDEIITGKEARLPINGSLRLLSVCTTRLCVSMDSINQPV